MNAPYTPTPDPRLKTKVKRALIVCFKAVIGAYVFVLLLFIAVRYVFFPNLDPIGKQALALASERLGVNIAVESIHAEWFGFFPKITLINTSIAPNAQTEKIVIPRMQATLSWSSIWFMEPRFQEIHVHNPSLKIQKQSGSQYQIHGFTFNTKNPLTNTPAHTSTNPLLSWLLNQGDVELIDTNLTFENASKVGQPTIAFNKASFRLTKTFRGWDVSTTGLIKEETARLVPFQVSASITRNLVKSISDPLAWSSRFYVDLPYTNIAYLLSTLEIPSPINSLKLASKTWGHFEEGKLKSLTSDLALNQLNLSLPKNQAFEVDHFDARVTYADYTTRQHLMLKHASLEAPMIEKMGPADYEVKKTVVPSTHQIDWFIQTNQLPIESVATLAQQLPLSDKIKDQLNSLLLKGYLNDANLTLTFKKDQLVDWATHFQFDHLHVVSSDTNLPSVKNLTGALSASSKEGFLNLSSRHSEIYLPNIFREPNLCFDEAKGTIHWTINPSLAVSFEKLIIHNQDASITANGSWAANKGAGVIDLSGKILKANIKNIPKYVPNVAGQGTINWLEGALLDGLATNGNFLIKGDFSRFPWKNSPVKDEKFLITLDAHHATLDFLPSNQFNEDGSKEVGSAWPLLTDIEASLRFEADGMFITGEKAKSLGLTASKVQVNIPSFAAKPVMLDIYGHASGPVEHALNYLNKGVQLNNILGGAFQQSKGNGDAFVDLELHIPLQRGYPIGLNIDANLQNASLDYGFNLPVVENLNGQLHITEQGVSASSPLTGLTPSGPLTVGIATKKEGILLDIQGKISSAEGQKLLNKPFADPIFSSLSGLTPVSVQVSIPLKPEQNFSISGNTTLEGLESQLPKPLSKRAQEVWPTHFEWVRNKGGLNQLSIQQEKNISALLDFSSATSTVQLGINQPLPKLHPNTPFSLSIKDLDLDAWLVYLDEQNETLVFNSSSGDIAEFSNDLLSIHTQQLLFKNRRFNHLNAHIRQLSLNAWSLDLDAKEVSGNITLTTPQSNQPLFIRANLKKLHLAKEAYDPLEALLEDSSSMPEIPNITARINDFIYDNRRFGTISFRTESKKTALNQELQIKNLFIQNEAGRLTGNLLWDRPKTGQEQTHLSLKANLDNTGLFLENLGFKDIVDDARGALDINLTWSSAPYPINFENFSGHISSHFEKGRLLQIEPGAGRLLNLFSMQHLMRRLSLDFKDVIYKGFSFKTMAFNASAKNGVLHLQNSSITGNPALVLLDGSLDLSQQNLDMMAYVYPDLSAGNSTIAIALANPIVGLSAFATQWLLKDQLQNLLSSTYSITGPLFEPIVTKVTSERLDPK